MKKRVLSLVLAVSLCASLLVVPASAVFDFTLSLDKLSVNFDIFFSEENNQSYLPNVCNSDWARSHYNTYSYSAIEDYVLTLNSTSEQYGYKFDIQPLGNTNYYGVRILYKTGSFGGGRQHNDQYASYVLAWLADELGNAVLSTPGTSSITSVRAIPRSQASSNGFYKMLSYEDLYNLAYDYNAQHNYKLALNTDGVYWAISPRGDYVLANESGLPYGAVGPSSITYGDNSRPDVDTGEDQLIDWSGGTAIDGNGDTFNYDGCIYDSSVKTYYIDNHTENYYYTYNYYIEKTYITYIGSSAEYTETYERYYELPDGRSSADLTKEDLEQLNLSMDVVPYIRSSDDTRLRSLYHFDGNTEDASYWNYATSFDWTTGASLTYLESNAFNGCLYLDELAHDFTITLPSSLGTVDFTVDFRYYQVYTGTPNNDSYISIGGQEVLRLTGSNFTFNGTNYATPVGNWNHLAFVRKNGTLYFYLNGVRQGSKAFSNALSATVQFNFGSSQQTYKYLDELRVTNFAVWESNFTPATVPYDTNLSLVLPTDTVPVADEYWDIQCENNLLSQYNLDWWDIEHSSSGLFSSNINLVYSNSRSSTNLLFNSLDHSNTTFSYSTCSNLYIGDPFKFAYVLQGSYSLADYLTFTNDTLFFPSYSTNSAPRIPLPNGISFLYYSSKGSYLNGFSASPFTLSMVSSDGSLGHYTFDLSTYTSNFDGMYSGGYYSYVSYYPFYEFNGYLFSMVQCFDLYSRSSNARMDSLYFLSIIPTEDAGEFVYLALEQGTESTVSAEFVSGVAGIPADDLNTPTLAVRSDIPITQKQIGGVRPTFAERGYVYAMVESGFITSLQQYTGYAWQAVDGRIWTGSRWIPYSSYNVITLSDMYDIADASGQGGYEYIYSQSGFWSWWQKQWLEFKAWYSGINIGGGGSGGDTNINVPIIAPDIDAEWDFSDDDLSFGALLIDLPKTAFSTASGLLKVVGNTLKNVPLALNTFVVQGNPLNPVGAFKVFIIPGT